MVTTGRGGRAMAFIDVFADLGVRHPGRAQAVRDLRWAITHYRQTPRHNDPDREAPGA